MYPLTRGRTGLGVPGRGGEGPPTSGANCVATIMDLGRSRIKRIKKKLVCLSCCDVSISQRGFLSMHQIQYTPTAQAFLICGTISQRASRLWYLLLTRGAAQSLQVHQTSLVNRRNTSTSVPRLGIVPPPPPLLPPPPP